MKTRMKTLWGLSPLISLFGAVQAGALPVLSEVFYDAVGSDDGFVFVEVYGEAGTNLDGLTIEGINGSGGGVTVNLALSGVIPADGLFVLADDAGGGVSSVPGADQVLNFDFQNGPDSILLTSTSRTGRIRSCSGTATRCSMRWDTASSTGGRSSPARGVPPQIRRRARVSRAASPTSTPMTTPPTSQCSRCRRPAVLRSPGYRSPRAACSWLWDSRDSLASGGELPGESEASRLPAATDCAPSPLLRPRPRRARAGATRWGPGSIPPGIAGSSKGAHAAISAEPASRR